MPSRVAVVGSGVIGLSVANELAGMGYDTTVISGQSPIDTTSAVAAAYWAPYWIGQYDKQWAIDTLAYLQSIAGAPRTGTCIRTFYELLTDEGADELRCELDIAYWWRHLPGIDYRWENLEQPVSLNFPGIGALSFTQRVSFTSVVARMPDYLMFLQHNFEAFRNARIESRWVDSLSDLRVEYDIVVNCTGWGAKQLCSDDPETKSMRLLAGHVVRVETKDQDHAISLHRGPFKSQPLYIVPRTGSVDDVICGGTAIEQTHLDPRKPFEFEIDPICDRIMNSCSAWSEAVRNGRRCENLVGLRPTRSSVRIERDKDLPTVFHCYGHGGSGLTLSKGSAVYVSRLVAESFPT